MVIIITMIILMTVLNFISIYENIKKNSVGVNQYYQI